MIGILTQEIQIRSVGVSKRMGKLSGANPKSYFMKKKKYQNELSRSDKARW